MCVIYIYIVIYTYQMYSEHFLSYKVYLMMALRFNLEQDHFCNNLWFNIDLIFFCIVIKMHLLHNSKWCIFQFVLLGNVEEIWKGFYFKGKIYAALRAYWKFLKYLLSIQIEKLFTLYSDRFRYMVTEMFLFHCESPLKKIIIHQIHVHIEIIMGMKHESNFIFPPEIIV